MDKFLYWDEEVNIIEAVTSVRHYIIMTSLWLCNQELRHDYVTLSLSAESINRASPACEVMEGHHGDTDETLFIQNLQSIADYVRAAQVSNYITITAR